MLQALKLPATKHSHCNTPREPHLYRFLTLCFSNRCDVTVSLEGIQVALPTSGRADKELGAGPPWAALSRVIMKKPTSLTCVIDWYTFWVREQMGQFLRQRHWKGRSSSGEWMEWPRTAISKNHLKKREEIILQLFNMNYSSSNMNCSTGFALLFHTEVPFPSSAAKILIYTLIISCLDLHKKCLRPPFFSSL